MKTEMILKIINLLVLVDLVSTFSLRPGGERMLFVSISYHGYGIDIGNNGNATTTDSALCEAAIERANRTKSKFWEFALSKGGYRVKNITSSLDIQYINLRFDNHEEATQIAVELKLNRTYFVDNNSAQTTVPKWNDLPIKNWSRASKIMYVMINCPKEYIGVFKNNLFGEDYIVIYLNSKFEFEDTFTDGNLISSSNVLSENTRELLYHIDTSFSSDRKQRKRQVESFGIISLASDEFISTYKLEFEFLKNYLLDNAKQLKKCFFTYTLNVTNNASLSDFYERLHQERSVRIFVIIGEPERQVQFYKYFYRQLSFLSSWIVYDLRSTNFPYIKGSSFYAFQENGNKYSSAENFKKQILEVKNHFGITEKLDPGKLILMKMCSQAFEDQILRMIQIVHMYQLFDAFQLISFKRFKQSCIRRSDAFKRGIRTMYEVHHRNVYEVRFHDLDNKALRLYHTSDCPKATCNVKRQEAYFGKINENPIWNSSYGWTCNRCKVNRFKPAGVGNLTCKPCPKRMQATQDGGNCFDPFVTQQYPNLTQRGAIVAITICVLSLIFTLFTMYIELKFRSTPFIKASDLRLSMFHLFSKAVVFIAVPFLFLGNLTPVKCLVQPVFLLMFCILPSTLILKKSQKILTAFRSKRKLSKQEQRHFLAVEYSMISVVALINGCILTISLYAKPATVSEELILEKFERRYFCNTGDHINIQIILLIAHHLLTTVQAYRGRNLPGPFNEAMQIIYSTFVTVILYLIVFPIYYLSDDVNVKSTVHLLVIPLSDCFFLIAFYLPRLYMVLGKSSKNTKEYVNRELMKMAMKNVDRQMSNS